MEVSPERLHFRTRVIRSGAFFDERPRLQITKTSTLESGAISQYLYLNGHVAIFNSSDTVDLLLRCARGICFVFRWRASPESRLRYFPARSESPVGLRCPNLNPRGRLGPESFACLALTRVSLDLELGFLRENPQALE
jgi:hypothetical protein